MRFTTLTLGALLCAVALPSRSHAEMIEVGSVPPIVSAGAFTTPGQILYITATGRIEMAISPPDNGPYDTDPNGKILALVARTPTHSWNVHEYMLLETDGLPIEVGGFVNISSYDENNVSRPNQIGQIVGSPFGGLMAGFSSTADTPTLSDFVNGFTFIGSSGSITVPVGAPYLFLSINDTNRTDNRGSYDVTISDTVSTPEPASMALLGLTGLGGLGLRWSQRRKSRGA